MFINLTPHEIKVQVPDYETGGSRILAIEPEPQPARVAAVETLVGYMYGVEISKHTFGKVENLPEPQQGVAFIVSGMVRDALKGRPDVLAPDTGKTAVRNQQGQVAYVTRLRTK